MPLKDREARNKYWRGRYRLRREYIDQIKIDAGGCKLCGWNIEPRILQFHHRDPADKDFQLSKVRAFAEKRIDKEVAKCDIMCPNCHQMLHFKENLRQWQKKET